jgi:uncharacterized protein (TIGR03437 family)
MLSRVAVALALVVLICDADPPGAMVTQQISVPASMQTDIFSSPRYVNVPPGFQISVWARVHDARFMAVAPDGDIFVAQPDPGQITILRPDPNGGVPQQFVYASGLTGPQGLAFSNVNGMTWLYVGETTQISRYAYNNGDTMAPADRQVLVTNLTGADAHPYKDIAIGPDGTVYFSYGSASNISADDVSAKPEMGAVYSMSPDGSNMQVFASGLRNAEGVTIQPGSNTVWVAVNARDDIPYPFDDSTGHYGQVFSGYVDNHPPDLVTPIQHGGNYGWPFCNPNPDTASGYFNMPYDNDFNTNPGGSAANCSQMTTIGHGIQAHSAPLGIRFLQDTNFAVPYRDGVIVAYHGSWDRSVPTGYEVAYFPWNDSTLMVGQQVDLVTGFLGFGRPVDTAVLGDGSLLISDDQSGTVYRLVWAPSAVSAANGYPVIAPESYASVYGNGLASQTAAAPAPYPVTLGGISLTITDSAGNSQQAPLVYVSPAQINFIVPPGLASGTGQLTLNGANGPVSLGSPYISSTAPSLFSASGDGIGVAAATVENAQRSPAPAFSCGQNGCAAMPINVSNGSAYLSLYGTGIRGAAPGSVQVFMNGISVPVLYAGAQPTEPGLDQINVQIPSSFAGAGQVRIQVGIGGATSNPVMVQVQ